MPANKERSRGTRSQNPSRSATHYRHRARCRLDRWRRRRRAIYGANDDGLRTGAGCRRGRHDHRRATHRGRGVGGYADRALLTEASAESYIATRPIGAGELVPLTALGDADTSSAAVVVSIPGELPGGISTGTTVEIWSAAAGERMGTYDAPQVLVAQAQVIRVIEQDDFVATAQVDVELRIPDDEVATVMSATSNGARLQLVPLHEPVRE